MSKNDDRIKELEEMLAAYKEQIRLHQKARKRVEARYYEECDSQTDVYTSGITEGLEIAMGLIDKTLAGE